VPTKLAVVGTHPIQYYAPWFARLASRPGLAVRVFYLWDFGVASHVDQGFQAPVQWDVPLLQGYDHEFVENRSSHPGTDSFFGLWNPTLPLRVSQCAPSAVLLTAYNFASIYHFLLRWRAVDVPLLFRGDSHRLVPPRGLRAALTRKFIASIFRRFDAVLYVGSANREYFVQHGVPPERLFHCPHAVDNDRFFAARSSADAEAPAWRRSLGIPDGNSVVLFAGKFEEKKRPLDLLHAFRDAALERASLLFVGSGPQDQALRAAASGLDNVHFAPFQNQSRIPTAYAASDVFVLPSYGPAETWGLAVNEAMCMGRAVIASTHVGGARDLVLPGVTGLVFPAGDVVALAEALREALRDRGRLKDWGMRGRERIEAFSYEQASAGVVKALRHLGLDAP
jgi:glycosyltransferase involved in cell wall biosynthesis